MEHGAGAARPRVGRSRVDHVFDALGDPGRRSLVEAVASRGSATATELAAALTTSPHPDTNARHALAAARMLCATRTARRASREEEPVPLLHRAGRMEASRLR